MGLFNASNDKSDIMDVGNRDQKCQNLVIFDELVTEKVRKKLSIYSRQVENKIHQ